jgi:DNA polymerase III subunit beta
MKATTSTSDLSRAAARAVLGLPGGGMDHGGVLQSMMIRADGGQITLSAFNYETASAASASATVEEPGEALVPGQLLASILRALPDRPLVITGGQGDRSGRVTLSSGAAVYQLTAADPAQYPELPALPPASAECDAGDLARAIRQVAPAAGKDGHADAVMCGVQLQLVPGERPGDEGVLRFQATDRYRLARADIPVAFAAAAGPPPAMLIRGPVLTAIGKNLGPGTVTLSTALGQDGKPGLAGFAVSDGTRLTVSVVAGELPSFGRLIAAADEYSSCAAISVPVLLDALRRAAIVTEKRGDGVRLAFSADGIALDAQGDGGTAVSDLIPADWEGPPREAEVNPVYLADALAAADPDRARIGFLADGGKSKALQVTANSDRPVTYWGLVMPINRDAAAVPAAQAA